MNGIELGHLQQSSIDSALAFNGGYIELSIRIMKPIPAKRTFRSSCSALDLSTSSAAKIAATPDTKVFSLGSAPSDLDYVPVYAGNCKTIANQISDDEKWHNLSKTRQGVVGQPQTTTNASDMGTSIIKPMSLMTLSQSPTKLDDVALKERLTTSMSCSSSDGEDNFKLSSDKHFNFLSYSCR